MASRMGLYPDCKCCTVTEPDWKMIGPVAAKVTSVPVATLGKGGILDSFNLPNILEIFWKVTPIRCDAISKIYFFLLLEPTRAVGFQAAKIIKDQPNYTPPLAILPISLLTDFE